MNAESLRGILTAMRIGRGSRDQAVCGKRLQKIEKMVKLIVYSWFHPNMTMLNTFLAKKIRWQANFACRHGPE